jgi:hypothetical protein
MVLESCQPPNLAQRKSRPCLSFFFCKQRRECGASMSCESGNHSSGARRTQPKPTDGRGASGPESCGTRRFTSRIRRRRSVHATQRRHQRVRHPVLSVAQAGSSKFGETFGAIRHSGGQLAHPWDHEQPWRLLRIASAGELVIRISGFSVQKCRASRRAEVAYLKPLFPGSRLRRPTCTDIAFRTSGFTCRQAAGVIGVRIVEAS